MARAPGSDRDETLDGFSRRSFLKGASGLAAGSALTASALAETAEASRPGAVARLAGSAEIELSINGAARRVTVEPRTTLLDTLRVHLDPPLTGAKPVCEMATCGACTVLVDGKPIYACTTLAVDCMEKEIRTVEGLAPRFDGSNGGALTPLQQAFVEEDAMMCGFCTSGFVMSLTACLEGNPKASLGEIKQACSGNLCRCGTYPHVFQAALSAGLEMQGGR